MIFNTPFLHFHTLDTFTSLFYIYTLAKIFGSHIRRGGRPRIESRVEFCDSRVTPNFLLSGTVGKIPSVGGMDIS